VLTNASLYIQTSRWEVFGISIAEAMYLGVPCAIADTLNLAQVFRQHDLGLVLPPDPKRAATDLLEVLNHPARLYQWSERARTFAQVHFHPYTVASEYLNLYEEILRV
jgi:glycosyltransferase involved in cell wall biosynthesis